MTKQERLSLADFKKEAEASQREAKASKKESQKQRLLSRFEGQIDDLPSPIREHRFHSARKWRFDYAWPEYMVAVEIHGGIWSKGGHVRGLQFQKDREKVFEAQLLGWTVIEIGTNHVEDGTGAGWVRRALEVSGR